MTKANDGRYAALAVLPVVHLTDISTDITALSHRADHGLKLLHGAHGDARCTHLDWGKYLDALEGIHSTHLAIRDEARQLAGAVEEAPRLSPDQLELSLCPAGLAGPGGHAA